MNELCENIAKTSTGDQIRLAKPGDIRWIISQHGLLYAREFHFDSTFEMDISRKAVLLCNKKDPFTSVWLKEINGKRAGSIAISKVNESLAFINFLLVPPLYRGKGVAKELMNRAFQHAETSGFERLRLETYSCLTSARKLYADLGFYIAEPVIKLSKYGQHFDQEFWELVLQRSED